MHHPLPVVAAESVKTPRQPKEVIVRPNATVPGVENSPGMYPLGGVAVLTVQTRLLDCLFPGRVGLVEVAAFGLMHRISCQDQCRDSPGYAAATGGCQQWNPVTDRIGDLDP